MIYEMDYEISDGWWDVNTNACMHEKQQQPKQIGGQIINI